MAPRFYYVSKERCFESEFSKGKGRGEKKGCPYISEYSAQIDCQSEFYLKLESDIDKDINLLIDNLIEKMKISGMKVDIIDKKYGEVPKIDIKEIEQKISKYELELQKNGTKELFNDLLKSYEQAIVFYSAINDKQYVTYSTRVKELLKNEKYAKYLS